MVDVSTVALSGLLANEKRIAVAANNIANANSANFQAQTVEQTSTGGGGVTARVVAPAPTTPVASNDNDGDADRPSNVSLDTEVVNAQVATYGAQANLKVLQVQDKLNKYLLDIQA